ncbi:MAG: TetR/AcrR family transcriptional regulator [Clostridiales bacterium]|nr:TetR/AcrR family transcriptional regulator [Clostridiales bacterium]MDO4350929.1 TetR/AcrR family transcriptional regulator [Eubacteriales bacterium]MDY4009989.1 TetR/AcrR family transcriptional regulator [Candidatus Limiplasma sp.]
MAKPVPDVQERLLHCAKEEFLQNGFQKASLRTIAQRADTTTGTIYTRFGGKEGLFDALVKEHAEAVMNRFMQAQDGFAQLPPDKQPAHMGDISGRCMDDIICYMYAHADAFKLLLCCAEGTRYEHFVHDMVEIEVAYTHRFVDVLHGLGRNARSVDPQLEHILVSGMFAAFFEVIIHDMPFEQARRYVQELRAFYTAGWRKLMGF